MLNIAFDGSALSLTGGGTATYLRELMKSIEALDCDASVEKFESRHLFSRNSRLLRTIDTLNRELIWQQFVLPVSAKKSNADILHCPAMISPIKCAIPVVLTILDAYIIRAPESFSRWQSFIMNRLLPKCIDKADRLIAISNFTKQEILQFYPHVPKDKIAVTSLGVDPIFRIVDDELKARIKHRYLLDKPFILSVCTIDPRKNLKTLVRAFEIISNRIDHDLVLVGANGLKSKELHEFICRSGLSDRIKFTGYVPLEDLPVIYNLADLFVYPSLYEGFGLPPLEAMACGCPVITSNVASLPEVVGDSALTIDPLDLEALTFSIGKIIHDEFERKSLIEKGLSRVKLFTWEKCARETLAVYSELK